MNTEATRTSLIEPATHSNGVAVTPGTVRRVENEAWTGTALIVAIHAADLAQGMRIAEDYQREGEEYFRTSLVIQAGRLPETGDVFAEIDKDHPWMGEANQAILTAGPREVVWAVLLLDHDDQDQEGQE